MELGRDIYYIISTADANSYPFLSGSIKSGASTKLYPVKVPLNKANSFPYLVYFTVSDTPTNTKGNGGSNPILDQRSILDVYRLQISMFSEDYSDTVSVCKDLRNLLDRYPKGVPVSEAPYIDSIVFDGYRELYENKIKKSGVFHTALDFIIRIKN